MATTFSTFKTALDTLRDREAALSRTIEQLEEQHEWANTHGHYDLRDAYTAGQRLLLSRLQEVQSAIRLIVA